MADLQQFWIAIWPNLAANVVWIPLAGIYHWWTRRRFDSLHDSIHELHAHLNNLGQRNNQSTELNVNNTINWGEVFKSPQTVISLLVAGVTAAGTVGLIDANLGGAIQTLLVAVLGVISAVTHVGVSAKVAHRRAQKALNEGENA